MPHACSVSRVERSSERSKWCSDTISVPVALWSKLSVECLMGKSYEFLIFSIVHARVIRPGLG